MKTRIENFIKAHHYVTSQNELNLPDNYTFTIGYDETIVPSGVYTFNPKLDDGSDEVKVTYTLVSYDKGIATYSFIVRVCIDFDDMLRNSCRSGNYDLVETSLMNGAKVSDYHIEITSAMGHYKIVVLLLQNGANVSIDKHNSALVQASEAGHNDVVKLLITAGSKISGNDDMALRLAYNNGHYHVVQSLLSYGASRSVYRRCKVKKLYNTIKPYLFGAGVLISLWYLNWYISI